MISSPGWPGSTMLIMRSLTFTLGLWVFWIGCTAPMGEGQKRKGCEDGIGFTYWPLFDFVTIKPHFLNTGQPDKGCRSFQSTSTFIHTVTEVRMKILCRVPYLLELSGILKCCIFTLCHRRGLLGMCMILF